MVIFRCILVMCVAVLCASFQADAQVPAYVGSESCADCHSDAYENWRGSHHAEAWRSNDDSIPESAFRGEIFEHKGMTATFTRRGDAFMINVDEADGSSAEYTVHSIGGTHPLLHPVIETEPGRLQSFDVVWDVEQEEWYHLYPDQDLLPSDAFHWSGPYKNWNARCAECHATGFEKNYDFATRSYASTQSEIGVGCEACHGPGEAHVRQVSDEDALPYSVPLTAWGFTAQMSEPASAMEQCAGCHARREHFGNGNPLPGTPFADAYNLSLLRTGLYHADGQILDEVYVYGSFLQSKMHQKGVTCSNCHEPHSAELIAEGNGVCTQCHSPAGNPDFPSLSLADYDSPEHHKHEMGTDAANCRNCHMSERLYMGIDWRRDHSFRVPRPDLAAETVAPDACTDCHATETSAWAAERISDWFPNGRAADDHYGQTIALGRNFPEYAAPFLSEFATDLDQPNLVRATALWMLETGGGDLSLKDVEPHLSDPDPVMRSTAMSALTTLPPEETLDYLVNGLVDPTRSVRVAAARAILSLPAGSLPPQISPQIRQAYQELTSVLFNQLDFPEAHLQLAGFALISRNFPAAIQALREVVRLDPQNTQAWASLVRTTAAIQGPTMARDVLNQAIRLNPDDEALRFLAREF